MATLGAFEVRYDLPVVFKATPAAAARQIESWAQWFSREIFRAANNLTKATNQHLRGATFNILAERKS
jgi:hypothetical protein